MEVSEKVKNAYLSGNETKHLVLHFPELNLVIGTERLYSETMQLSESIMESGNVEFVGCIASKFSIQAHGIRDDIKGKRIVATIHTDSTADSPVTLFSGIVDSAVLQANKRYKQIVAYDDLYSKGNIDVSSWYKGIAFPATLKAVRDSLFTYIGISQEEKDLPNDDVFIDKQYAPQSLQAISVIKAVCQINGAFGIINRENKFEYRILSEIFAEDSSCPPLYPPFYPGMDGGGQGSDQGRVQFPYYRKVDYEEFSVKPVERVTIRDSAEDSGITYGEGTNNYIIQNNMFAYGLSDSVLREIAENIHKSISGITFQPFSASNTGMPWMECGVNSANYVVYDFAASEKARSDQYTDMAFYLFKRELKGIQALSDVYSAVGEEYQTEFITDLQTQIDSIKNDTQQIAQNTVKDYTYSREEIDQMSKDWYRIVDIKPDTFEQGVIYFVRK